MLLHKVTKPVIQFQKWQDIFPLIVLQVKEHMKYFIWENVIH
jgi:hypothetical protein